MIIINQVWIIVSLYYAPDFLKARWANANANPTHPILSSPIKFIPLLLQISAVARNQILGGHTVNRGVGNGGARLYKSQNIGWARGRVPTVQKRPCVIKFVQFYSVAGEIQ